MTQIFDISHSTNWFKELQRTITDFYQEIGVRPHIYAHTSFKDRCFEILNPEILLKDDTESERENTGWLFGCYVEMDDSVDPGCVILKA